MLYIDDKKIKVTEQTISIGQFIRNIEKGYNINIQLQFINTNNNEKGYINLDVGYEKDCNIELFLNRNYCGIPLDSNDNQYIFFEVYDTEKFLDTEIESNITIKLSKNKKGKVKAYFEVNDELIKIKYDGYLDIDFLKTRDTFTSY